MYLVGFTRSIALAHHHHYNRYKNNSEIQYQTLNICNYSKTVCKICYENEVVRMWWRGIFLCSSKSLRHLKGHLSFWRKHFPMGPRDSFRPQIRHPASTSQWPRQISHWGSLSWACPSFSNSYTGTFQSFWKSPQMKSLCWLCFETHHYTCQCLVDYFHTLIMSKQIYT